MAPMGPQVDLSLLTTNIIDIRTNILKNSMFKVYVLLEITL